MSNKIHRGVVMLRAVSRGFAAALLSVVATPAPAAEDTYDLHVIIPLTGGGAFLGKAEQDSIRVAEKVINQDGGIHGKKLNVVFHDDHSSPQVAVQLTIEVIAAAPHCTAAACWEAGPWS
jgi:ABC-type branched-subunit amino acid transport system substrate-binding protein